MTRPYGKGQIKKGISLFPKHVEILEQLEKLNYANGISPIIRKALEEALERQQLEFVCTNQDCDNRPFSVTKEQFEDAEQVILCEYCDKECREVTK